MRPKESGKEKQVVQKAINRDEIAKSTPSEKAGGKEAVGVWSLGEGAREEQVESPPSRLKLSSISVSKRNKKGIYRRGRGGVLFGGTPFRLPFGGSKLHEEQQ